MTTQVGAGPIYDLDVSRDGRFWMVRIEGVGATQARSLNEVEEMARDYIAGMLEIPEGSFGVSMTVNIPAEVRVIVDHAAELRAQEQKAREEAAAESRRAVKELAAEGWTVRDIGRALNVSHQRAHQLVNS